MNAPLTGKERERMESCLKRGRPLGEDRWAKRTAARLHLEHTIRPEGRPRKHTLPQARRAKPEPSDAPPAGAGPRRKGTGGDG